VSPVPLSVAPSCDTDGGSVGLSEVTHPDDNPIEVADGSQKRRPPIRTSAGGSFYGHRDWLQKRRVSDRSAGSRGGGMLYRSVCVASFLVGGCEVTDGSDASE
jgi:hypothetical protein